MQAFYFFPPLLINPFIDQPTTTKTKGNKKANFKKKNEKQNTNTMQRKDTSLFYIISILHYTG
jgi:hypothetical protein